MKTVKPNRLFLFISRLLANIVHLISALFIFLSSTGLPLAAAQAPFNRSGAFVYTGGSNTLINGYVIDATAGTLTQAAGTPFATIGQVFAIAAHPSGKFVYALVGGASVAAFTVDSFTGTLTPVSGSPFGEAGGSSEVGTVLAIDPGGKFLYLASSNNLYAFVIDAGTGALTAVPGSPFLSGVSAVAIHPSGKFLVAFTGFGSGALAYSIDGGTGALTAAGSQATGCGGSFMVFEPSGHFLYGTGSQTSISECSFNSSSGALLPLAGSPLPTTGSFRGLAVHPSGAFLYASNILCDPSLHGYIIDPASGALTEIDGSPFPFPSPSGGCYDYGVSAEASGRFLYAVEANSGTAAYKVNSTTGALTLAANSFSEPPGLTLETAPNAVSASAILIGLQVVPGSAQILTSAQGKQYQFTLKGTFNDGSTGFLTGSATWTSSDPGVATVAAGLVTSAGYGTTTISASVNGLTTTASLTVNAPALSSISVKPQTVTIYQGTAIQLKATGQFADGSTADLTNTATWNSSATTVATVGPHGLVQSVGLGTATITATQSVAATASLTVVPAFEWQSSGSTSTSATVSSGSTANFSLVLAPDQKFIGVVTFSCSNLPPNSVCTLDPRSADLANGNKTTLAANIITGQSLSAQLHNGRTEWGLTFAILAILVLLLPTGGHEGTRRFTAAVIFLFAGLTLGSCGGGGGGSTHTSVTPPGTYMVVVSAASSGIVTQNIQLTVTVQ